MPVLDLPNGIKLHLNSAEYLKDARFIADEVFQQGVYQSPGFELRPTDIVVDIGAHLGLFALWAAPQLLQGRIVCIEPSASMDSLEQSLASNGLSNITLHRCAVGAPGATIQLIDCPRFAGLNRAAAFRLPIALRLLLLVFGKHGPETRLQTCPCHSLEDILQHENLEHIDLLKVDCEGGEYDILNHASDAVLRRVKRIVMEFHEYHPSHDHRQLVDRLRNCGFKVQVWKKSKLHFQLYKTGMLWAARSD